MKKLLTLLTLAATLTLSVNATAVNSVEIRLPFFPSDATITAIANDAYSPAQVYAYFAAIKAKIAALPKDAEGYAPNPLLNIIVDLRIWPANPKLAAVAIGDCLADGGVVLHYYSRSTARY